MKAGPRTPHEAIGTTPEIQDYTRFAGEYDRRRYVGETDALNEAFRREVLETLLPRGVARALDVACGTGRGVLVLQSRSRFVLGLDGTMEMLHRAREKTAQTRAQYVNANAAALPFPDRAFDVVTCLNFLHLFPAASTKLAFVLEIARVLRPGGIGVFEFDNALHGLLLGPIRKYFGTDIGYDWPWTVRSCFPPDVFGAVTVQGTNLPGIWRVRRLRRIEAVASAFPVKYLANRLFVRAVRR